MRPYFHADLAVRTLLAGSSQPLQDASTLHDVKQHADGVNSNICETVIRTNTKHIRKPRAQPHPQKQMVEPDGIEPTTS